MKTKAFRFSMEVEVGGKRFVRTFTVTQQGAGLFWRVLGNPIVTLHDGRTVECGNGNTIQFTFPIKMDFTDLAPETK